MFHAGRFVICVAVFMVAAHGLTQQKQPQDNTKPNAGNSTPAVKKVSAPDTVRQPPKPTAEQSLALQTLETSEAASRGFEAPMRSYGLLQIGSTFATLQAEKARSLLRDAFTASLEIHDDDDTKSRLQQEIFRTLLPLSQDDVEELMPQAEIKVRKQASETIIGRYIEKKQFDKAIDLINQVTSWDEFPYGSAITLMEAMPAEMIAERQALLVQAVNSYKNHEHSGVTVGRNDLTYMLSRFGHSMPPKLVMQGIDEVLQQAKSADEKNQSDITLGGQGGTVEFSSLYEYRLFAVLPLLQELDEGRAKQLLEDDQALQTNAQKFPAGLQSIDPGKNGNHGFSTHVSSNSKGSALIAAGQSYRLEEAMQKMRDIAQEGETDPTQAIAHSMTLPLNAGDNQRVSPRAAALEAIARANVKKNTAGADQALSELRKAIVDLPPRTQVQYLSSAANLCLQMEEKDNADKVVAEGFKVAEQLLEQDVNPDSPNEALKAWWPSADAYRRFVEVETKISRPATLNILKEIKDPEIRAIESIAYARTLLDLPVKRFTVMEKRGHSTSIQEGN